MKMHGTEVGTMRMRWSLCVNKAKLGIYKKGVEEGTPDSAHCLGTSVIATYKVVLETEASKLKSKEAATNMLS